ncbi:hypothetical protein CFAL_07775 [Corynebacterium falsenii DSM 44353]|nr:hypothetical protein CFAL_07775 [Corynebacterium falsenii DSM 44353]
MTTSEWIRGDPLARILQAYAQCQIVAGRFMLALRGL